MKARVALAQQRVFAAVKTLSVIGRHVDWIPACRVFDTIAARRRDDEL
jgi:hypothetical protein